MHIIFLHTACDRSVHTNYEEAENGRHDNDDVVVCVSKLQPTCISIHVSPVTYWLISSGARGQASASNRYAVSRL